MSCIVDASGVDEIYELAFDPETNVYTCSQCSISFDDADEHLKDYHSELFDEDKSTIQQIVSDPQSLESIEEEYEEVDGIAIVMDNPKGKMSCEGCSKTFKSLKRFTDHLKTHGSQFQDTINVFESKNETTSADDKEQFCEQIICDDVPDKICYRCLECTTIFDTKKSFLLHYKIHTNRRVLAAKREKFPKGKMSCKLCNKSIPNQKLMDMHMRAHSQNESHQSRKPYNIDDKKLPTDQNQIVNKLACQYCNKVFKRPVEKVKHERVHSGEKPFSCELCGKAFRVAYCLTLHKRSVHSDERPFVCTFNDCHKRFKSQSVYNHHLASHGSEKNFICPFCDKAFKTSVQLSGHKNTHTKPFNCSQCTRKFASLFAVKAHMETHKTSALKFKCLICSAAYGRTSALNDHMKTIHPEEAQLEIVDTS